MLVLNLKIVFPQPMLTSKWFFPDLWPILYYMVHCNTSLLPASATNKLSLNRVEISTFCFCIPIPSSVGERLPIFHSRCSLHWSYTVFRWEAINNFHDRKVSSLPYCCLCRRSRGSPVPNATSRGAFLGGFTKWILAAGELKPKCHSWFIGSRK